MSRKGKKPVPPHLEAMRATDEPRLQQKNGAGTSSRRGPRAWLAAAALATAIAAVYIPALNAPLFFDDIGTIAMNKSIVSLWPLVGTAEQPGPLRPVAQLPTASRPLVNLSFAVNYRFGQTSPWGYRAVNVLIHFGSSLLLWAIVRRALLLPFFSNRFQATGGWLALAVALLWALHPLQTEAVIYITQRTELMMAFFYLATLYCSLRYWSFLPLPQGEGRGEGGHTTNRPSNRQPPLRLSSSQAGPTFQSPRTWLFLAILACACGMASKEVMVSAPLMVLFFDRTFISGSLPKALRQSLPLYLGLSATWLLLAAVILSSPRSDTAGFHVGPPLPIWWMTQAEVLLIYLKLVAWPAPLLVHYQLPYLGSFAVAWMYVVPVAMIGFATLALLWRNHPLGYLGTWVFAILSPTTVVPILTEMAAERRMYLPLAAILVLLVVGGYLVIQALVQRAARARLLAFEARRVRNWSVALAIAAVFICGLASAERARAYFDPMLLWQQVVDHQPQNFVAHAGLGDLYLKDSARRQEAIDAYKTTLELNPDHLAARCNLGRAYILTGQYQNAIEVLEKAVKSNPDYPEAINSLGLALMRAGRLAEAISAFEVALKLDSTYAAAHANLGAALVEFNRAPDAIEHLQRAVQLDLDDAETRINLGRALMSVGRTSEAIAEFKVAIAKSPNDPVVLNNFGYALIQLERFPEAVACLELAVRLKPDYAFARDNLGNALFRSGSLPRAIEHFERALRLNPNDIIAHSNLAILQAQAGRKDEAIKHHQEVVRIQPGFIQGYFNLAQALKLANREEQAIAAAQKGVEVARAGDQTAAAEQIESWLANELKVPQTTPGALPAEAVPQVQ